MKLSERLGEMTYIVGQHTWLSGGDSGNEPIEALRNGVQELVDLYSKRGYLLRAISDAAVTDRPVENAYREMIARYIEVTATRIRLGTRNGAIKNVNANEMATALVLFNNGYLIEKFGRETRADRKYSRRDLADGLETSTLRELSVPRFSPCRRWKRRSWARVMVRFR